MAWLWRCGVVARFFPCTLTKFSQLIPEPGDLMLGVWISCASRELTLDLFCYLLSCVFCVGCLVQYFPILSCSEVGDPVQVDATVSELCQQFSSEYDSRDIPRRDQVLLHDHEPVSEANGCWLVDTSRLPLVVTEDHIPRCPAFV